MLVSAVAYSRSSCGQTSKSIACKICRPQVSVYDDDAGSTVVSDDR